MNQAFLPGDQMQPHRTQTRCRRCRAPVWFNRTERGSMGIFDWDPVPGGTVILLPSGTVRHLAQDDTKTPGPRFQSHFVSCPFADEFRS